MKILTRQFGPVDYEQAAALEFPVGLPGFEGLRHFVLVERTTLAPIVFLQSLDAPDVCFPTTPVQSIDPRYQLALTPEDRRQIELDECHDEILCLSILSAPENGPLTANLLAPVVVNPRTRRGIQAIRIDSRYSHQHPLAKPEKEAELTCS